MDDGGEPSSSPRTPVSAAPPAFHTFTPDGAAEEHRVLGDDGQLAAQNVHAHPADVETIQEDGSGAELNHPAGEGGQARMVPERSSIILRGGDQARMVPERSSIILRGGDQARMVPSIFHQDRLPPPFSHLVI